MNLKKSIKHRRGGSDDVNITPVMNLFLVLIPFLLLAAVFVRIAVLELSLPSLSQQATAGQKKDEAPKSVVLILLAITKDGFEMKAPGMRLNPLPLNGDLFQFDVLAKQLESIKEKYPDTDEITIQPGDEILYETIVKVMDTCRENGFPNISISG